MTATERRGCANGRPCILFLLLTALLTSARVAPVIAQPARVVVTGVVTDPSGGAVVGATIEATAGTAVLATTTTDGVGRYRLELPAAAEHLLISRDGFARTAIPLSPTASPAITHDVTLQIAAVGDQVVVTASRVPERRAFATASMSVFTAEDVASLGAASLADVLRMTPGLNVESTGREGALTSVFARGGESDYNQVLVDGVRVNTSGGQYDFSRVTASEIERVEVVRGAQSALYGSDAIGSVVQVFTRQAGAADAPTIGGALEGGSFNTWRGDLSVLGGALGRVDYHAGVAYRGSDGAFDDLLPERDRFDERSLNLRLGAAIGARARVSAGLRRTDAEGRVVGPIVFGARDRGTSYESADTGWHLDVSDRPTMRFGHSASFSQYRVSSLSADRIADPSYIVYALLEGRPGALFPASPRLVRLLDRAAFDALRASPDAIAAGQFLATTPFGVSDFASSSANELRRPAFKYQADLEWDGQTTIGGYEYEREHDPRDAAIRVETHAYFVQHQVAFADRWFVSAGVRVNDNSRFGTEVSPRVSVGGFIRPYSADRLSSVKVFANVGRGIKNPTFFELYGSAFVDGNRELHPERARSLDVGAEITADRQRWLARVTYFDNRFNDQVAFRSSGPGLDGRPDYLNIDGSKASGWEIEGALQRPLRGLSGSAAYWYTDTEVVSFVSTSEQFQPGQPLLRRPRHAALVRVSYALGRVTAALNVRHTGMRHDAAFLGLLAVPSAQFPNGRPVDITVNPSYTRVGAGLDVRLHDAATVFLRLENATDADYQSVLGYPGLPRAVMAGARWTLGK